MYVITDTAPRKARAMHARGRDQAEPNGSPTQNPTARACPPPVANPIPMLAMCPRPCNHMLSLPSAGAEVSSCR